MIQLSPAEKGRDTIAWCKNPRSLRWCIIIVESLNACSLKCESGLGMRIFWCWYISTGLGLPPNTCWIPLGPVKDQIAWFDRGKLCSGRTTCGINCANVIRKYVVANKLHQQRTLCDNILEGQLLIKAWLPKAMEFQFWAAGQSAVQLPVSWF